MPALAYAARPTADSATPTVSAVPDRTLLEDLAAGDNGAWQRTVRRYEGLLRASARAVVRNDADVDEAVQRTWVLLLSHAFSVWRPSGRLASRNRPSVSLITK